ncbi:MAG: hypothetical protein JWO12_2984 [Frankiales bacterium]|nr:hypothetical protein [Frankiales bacterium]
MTPLSFTGVLGPVALAVGSFVAARAQPAYNARQEDLSALAASDAHHPWIMVASILLFAAGVAAVTWTFTSSVAASVPAQFGAVFLGLLGALSAAAALLRNDCSTELPSCTDRSSFSWHHYGHDIAGVLVMLLLVAVPLVVAEAFHADPRWHALVWPSRVAGWLATTGLLLYLLTDSSLTHDQGLLQRASMLPAALWLMLVAWALRRGELP